MEHTLSDAIQRTNIQLVKNIVFQYKESINEYNKYRRLILYEEVKHHNIDIKNVHGENVLYIASMYNYYSITILMLI